MFFRHFHQHGGHGRGGPGREGFERFRRGGGFGGREGRMFDGGELRLVILALIAEKPRHGYEVIKALGERAGGDYSPSPGVVYPTLTLLKSQASPAPAPTKPGASSMQRRPRGKRFSTRTRRRSTRCLRGSTGRAGPVGRRRPRCCAR